MVSGVSSDSGKGGGKPSPPVHWVNMDKWYKYYLLLKELQGSNCDKQRYTFPGYENELVPWGGPEIWSI